MDKQHNTSEYNDPVNNESPEQLNMDAKVKQLDGAEKALQNN